MPDLRDLEQIITKRITEEQCNNMLKVIIEEEIKSVVFQTPSSKAPGPDGFVAEVFKCNWETVKKEVVEAIKYCYDQEYMYFQ